MSETKTNFILAVRGYKIIKKQRTGNCIDIVALDNSNNTVLLRTIEPLTPEYIGMNDIKTVTDLIKQESYGSAILISKHFTLNAIEAMGKQKIQYISEDYMPPFNIQELYSAVMNCANNACQKRCGKILTVIPDCDEKTAYVCKTKALAASAKQHLETGAVGLLKNDLRVAVSLTP
jgi:hypothetical protein